MVQELRGVNQIWLQWMPRTVTSTVTKMLTYSAKKDAACSETEASTKLFNRLLERLRLQNSWNLLLKQQQLEKDGTGSPRQTPYPTTAVRHFRNDHRNNYTSASPILNAACVHKVKRTSEYLDVCSGLEDSNQTTREQLRRTGMALLAKSRRMANLPRTGVD